MRFKKAYLEITNVCNLHCAFCPGTRRAQRFMTRDEFTTLAARLRPYTDYLYLHLMGEPLLHPELPALLDAAGALGFRVIVTTNGTLLHSCGGALIAAPAVHKVNVSLQSHHRKRSERCSGVQGRRGGLHRRGRRRLDHGHREGRRHNHQ